MKSFARKKVLVFGVLGAVGCLLGWAVGEGLLAVAAQPSVKNAPSLISTTTPPAPTVPVAGATGAPPPPAAPNVPAHLPLTPVEPSKPVIGVRVAPPPPPDILERLKIAGGKSGEIQITLVWNNRNDLDLHCIDPHDEEINYQHKKAEKSGGTLDVDRNAAVGNAVDEPIENIFFPAGASPGHYRVYVNYYAKRVPDPTVYKVSLLVEDKRRSLKGAISQGDKRQLVCEFDLPGLRVATPAEMIVNQGGRNKFRVLVERHKLNTGPITVTFADAEEGLKLPTEVTIPADKDEAEVEVSAEPNAPPSVRKVQVFAKGKFGKAETECAITVQSRTSLGLAVSPEVVLYPGGTNRVRVVFNRVMNPKPVDLRFEGETDGLMLPGPLSITGDSAELKVSAALTATDGPRKLRVVARGAHGKVEADCQIVVRRPPSALHLAASPAVEVRPGETNRIPVRIARAWFNDPVRVRAISAAGVSVSEITIPAGQNEGELELTAPADAKPGSITLTLKASGESTEATATLTANIIPPPPPPSLAPSWSWRQVLVISLWTALLAIGLCLALAIGQNRYLGRPWISGRQAGVLIAGGGLAGVVAGGIGQTLFGLMARGGVMPEVGFLAGWLLLGGLLGRGVGFFVPNLHPWRSALAGMAGGLLGALAFILVSKVHVAPGRLAGATLLGGCIGLMVALVELAFRTAWIEVRYSASEVVTVNLGPNPIRIGGDNTCTIWARGAPPLALLFWVRHGKVMCEDAVNQTKKEVKDGSRHRAGTLEVVVRTGEDETPSPPVLRVERPTRTATEVDDMLPLPIEPRPPRPSATEDDFDSLPMPISPPPPPAKPPVPKPASGATKPPVPRAGGSCPKCLAKLAPGKRSCPECGASW